MIHDRHVCCFDRFLAWIFAASPWFAFCSKLLFNRPLSSLFERIKRPVSSAVLALNQGVNWRSGTPLIRPWPSLQASPLVTSMQLYTVNWPEASRAGGPSLGGGLPGDTPSFVVDMLWCFSVLDLGLALVEGLHHCHQIKWLGLNLVLLFQPSLYIYMRAGIPEFSAFIFNFWNVQLAHMHVTHKNSGYDLCCQFVDWHPVPMGLLLPGLNSRFWIWFTTWQQFWPKHDKKQDHQFKEAGNCG